MDIKRNLEEILKQIPENVKLVVVSKTMPVAAILEAYNTGHRVFGENKAQELINKQQSLPGDINWHFIGHLQRNKVKQIVPFVSMIESVDSERLLREINKEGSKAKRVIDCLLQFHIATEDSKFGFDRQEAFEMLGSKEFRALSHVRICGVMGMATWTEDTTLIRKEFRSLSSIFIELRQKYFPDPTFFNEISMGMSGDYKIAIEEGSTIIRIGSAIFGERHYSA
jgi:PLP dependent protein